MKTIASLKNEIDNLTKENVKISDEDKIKEIQEILENEDLTNATEEEKAQIESLEKKCDDLQKAIKAKKEALREDAVKTGDSDSLYIWFILFVVSAFLIRRKRTEQY